MPFAKIYQKKQKRSNRKRYERPNWLTTSLGQHVIRILDEEALDEWTHFIRTPTYKRGLFVTCTGDDCPVCANNDRIFAENPEKPSSVPGWAPRNVRYYVNVLDRTPVKVCPKCQFENKKPLTGDWSPVCMNNECNNLIMDIKPHSSGKVKVFSKGSRVFDLLETLDVTTLDENGDRIGITNFDVTLHVTGNEKRPDTVPLPLPANNDEVSVPEDALYDLETIPLRLTAEELTDVMAGTQLGDIFTARKEENQADNVVNDLGNEVTDEIKDAVANLLG